MRKHLSADNAGVLHISASAGSAEISSQHSAPVNRVSPLLTVVIPVRNDPDRLRRCVQSICAVAGARAIDVIVVDNGSTDDTAQVAAASGARVLSHPDLRVGELRNRGARMATTELLAFVDADHELLDGWYEAAVEAFADETTGAAGALCLPPTPGTWVQKAYDTLRPHGPTRHAVEWLGAGNLVVRRSAFTNAGGFDDSLEACEDVDLCRALIRDGWRIFSDSRFRNVHHGDPSTLRQLLISELWRGRNNVVVSLRPPIRLRSLVSVAISAVQLVALGTIAGGAICAAVRPRTGGLLAICGVAVFLVLSALRVARMWRRYHPKTARGLWNVARVGVTYDVARALALVYRVRHRRGNSRKT